METVTIVLIATLCILVISVTYFLWYKKQKNINQLKNDEDKGVDYLGAYLNRMPVLVGKLKEGQALTEEEFQEMKSHESKVSEDDLQKEYNRLLTNNMFDEARSFKEKWNETRIIESSVDSEEDEF